MSLKTMHSDSIFPSRWSSFPFPLQHDNNDDRDYDFIRMMALIKNMTLVMLWLWGPSEKAVKRDCMSYSVWVHLESWVRQQSINQSIDLYFQATNNDFPMETVQCKQSHIYRKAFQKPEVDKWAAKGRGRQTSHQKQSPWQWGQGQIQCHWDTSRRRMPSHDPTTSHPQRTEPELLTSCWSLCKRYFWR